MSINKVILVGNVGKDPDVKYFDNGSVVANFTLATTERGYTAANGTQIPDRTEWHNIVVRRDQVQFVEKWVKKGSMVYVEGKIRTRTYDDQNGIKRYLTEIHADRVEFFSSGRPAESGTQPAATTAQQPMQNQPSTAYSQPMAQQNPSLEGNNSEDDLPF